jgi:hypothetical protein
MNGLGDVEATMFAEETTNNPTITDITTSADITEKAVPNPCLFSLLHAKNRSIVINTNRKDSIPTTRS